MQQIADGARPRRAVERPPVGWLEPGNLKHMRVMGCETKAFATKNPSNRNLFQKTAEEDYEMMSPGKCEQEIFWFLSKPGSAVVFDDGIVCNCLVRPSVNRTVLIVDPHDTKRAVVTNVTQTVVETVRRICNRGVMCLGVQRG